MPITGFRTQCQEGVSLVTLQVEGAPVITLEGYMALTRHLAGEARKPEVGAVVVTGPPGRFFFGMDLSEIDKLKTGQATRGVTSFIQDLLNDLEASFAPLVCAVDGTCFGGGLELILACHVVFASPPALFGLPEIKVGTIPSYGGTQRLTRIIGRNRALKAMLTGEPFSAKSAMEWGLVAAVVQAEQLIPTALEFAKKLAALSRPAVRALLDATLQGLHVPLSAGLWLESRNSSRLAGGKDLEEGIRAFFEKRAPLFPSTRRTYEAEE